MKFFLSIDITLFLLSFTVSETINKNYNLLSTKTVSKVEAVLEDINNSETHNTSYFSPNLYFRKLFSLSSTLNKCQEENCEFCCLSLNTCGSREQCENSNFALNILKFMFIFLCAILMTFLIYKIYITDPEPAHSESDKIDENTLNDFGLVLGIGYFNFIKS